VRNATLFPVLAEMVFLLGFHGSELDLNYSARPLARMMAQQAPDAQTVAVSNVRRDLVYGLAFYRNREPVDYASAGVPAGEHLLVVPSRDNTSLEHWLRGRIYVPLFLYQPQGLEVYRVYPAQ